MAKGRDTEKKSARVMPTKKDRKEKLRKPPSHFPGQNLS